jgi:hypothetical protein
MRWVGSEEVTMQTLTAVRTISRNLAYELIAVRHHWRPAWSWADVSLSAKRISGYIAAVIAISFAVNLILSAPGRESTDVLSARDVVNDLHIAVPSNLRGFAIEQLVPLP